MYSFITLPGMHIQGVLMPTASKQGMAAVGFGDLHCSCDGFRSPELPSTLSCAETVRSGCSIYTLLLVSASGLGEH